MLFAMGRIYQNLTFRAQLWHAFCYACALVKCFTWNNDAKINVSRGTQHKVLTKVKSKTIRAIMLVC